MILTNNRKLKFAVKNSGFLRRWSTILWILFIQIIKSVDQQFQITKIIATLTSLVVVVLVLPIFAGFFIALSLYRFFVTLWITLRAKDDIEIEERNFRSSADDGDLNSLVTLLFCLEGELDEVLFRTWVNENFLQEGLNTSKVKKFRCVLTKQYGYMIWRNDPQFSIDRHVIFQPQHHKGRTVTERNIQEYVSEISSEPLNQHEPPWQIKIIPGFSDYGSPLTWVVFRFHHLLSRQVHSCGFPMSFPNPWESEISHRSFALFEAPSAIKTLMKLICKDVTLLIQEWFNIGVLKIFIVNLFKFNVSVINFHLIYSFPSGLVRFLFYVIRGISTGIKKYMWIVYTKFVVIVLGQNDYFNLVIHALYEIFWIIRAICSSPRLLLEELVPAKSTIPPNMLRKQDNPKWNRSIVSWSENIPLGGANGVKGITGASLSSILITALTGGIRDLIRHSGVLVPDELRCTLPVYVPYATSTGGILPLVLPTGCTNGREALNKVCQYLDNTRRYPERYLASVWFINNLTDILPNILVKKIANYVTDTHPFLLTNLVCSSSLSTLWNLNLKSAFYWRPPLRNAVLSICMSTYCGQVRFGILVDGWVIPQATMLPQSFTSHLNELAVESGVKLERQSSRSWLNGRRSSKLASSSSLPDSPPRETAADDVFGYSIPIFPRQARRHRILPRNVILPREKHEFYRETDMNFTKRQA